MVPLGDIFFVCRVFRRGGMQPSKDKSKKKDEKTPEYRRPVGVAAISLSHAGIKRGKEVENTLPIYYHTKDENAFYNMVERAFFAISCALIMASPTHLLPPLYSN